MKFRKKPVEIDAVLWDGNNVDEVLPFIMDGKPDFTHLPITDGYIKAGVGHTPVEGTLHIPTLEGTMIARAGDWIIRGIKGEFYPCMPDIFEATYEEVVITPFDEVAPKDISRD